MFLKRFTEAPFYLRNPGAIVFLDLLNPARFVVFFFFCESGFAVYSMRRTLVYVQRTIFITLNLYIVIILAIVKDCIIRLDEIILLLCFIYI